MRRAALLSSTRSLNPPPTSEVKFAPVDRWCEISGMGRTATYQALAAGYIRAKKIGVRTLFDVNHGLSWLHSLPDAEVRLPNSRREILPQLATP